MIDLLVVCDSSLQAMKLEVLSEPEGTGELPVSVVRAEGEDHADGERGSSKSQTTSSSNHFFPLPSGVNPASPASFFSRNASFSSSFVLNCIQQCLFIIQVGFAKSSATGGQIY